MAVTFETSQRLKPERNDGPEAALEELWDSRSLLNAVFLYTGDVSSSFSKAGSDIWKESLSRLRYRSCMLVRSEGLTDRSIAGCILSMFLSRRDILMFDFSICWTTWVRSWVLFSAAVIVMLAPPHVQMGVSFFLP